jgi:hypothetical protein
MAQESVAAEASDLAQERIRRNRCGKALRQLQRGIERRTSRTKMER